MKKSFFLAAMVLAFSVTACSDDTKSDEAVENESTATDTSDDDDDAAVETYTAPDYADDYASIAGWGDRFKWNLANVHDPTVAYFDGDGYYYMYGTDASYGNAHAGNGHFHGRRSKDLVNWEYLGAAMDETPPSWIADTVNARRTRLGLEEIAREDISYGYWAPTVRCVTSNGTKVLRMYYSIVIDNYIGSGLENTTANFDGTWNERAIIGMRECSDPYYNLWSDKGYVLSGPSDKGLDWSRASVYDYDAYCYYNAIDPSYIVTPESEHWLVYGSWHCGIGAVQLNAETGKPLEDLGDPWGESYEEIMKFGKLISTRTQGSRWQASEGPEVIYRDGYYYLFLAYDALDVPYNTRVVRSSTIDGMYYDMTGRNSTNGRGDCYPIVTHPYKFNDHSGWVGISHCGVFQQSGTDNWFFVSQGRLPANTNGNAYSNAIMMGHVRRLVWCPTSVADTTDQWPIALPERYAAVPDYGTITADSIAGTWEHINVEYSYGVQNEAQTLTLSSGGKASGAISGTWSYDEKSRLLTIGNYVVRVERELDWEATPRVPTLVYAGADKDAKLTFWGKKVK